MKREQIFSILCCEIKTLRTTKSKPVRLAINGIEGTGKTHFAEAFVKHLNCHGMNAVHVSIDGFHCNKELRYRQGRDSAKGYYEDSYDEAAFVAHVLLLSQQTPAQYIEATYDLMTDRYLDYLPKTLTDDSVIVTEGCYLFKPVFNPYWDFRVYLKTDFETALERGALRDQALLGGYEKAKDKFKRRYHAASKHYISEVKPEQYADLIIDMTDFEDLKIVTDIM